MQQDQLTCKPIPAGLSARHPAIEVSVEIKDSIEPGKK